jgi:2-polyprenyl-3-methyl-5-hydroxy-6-metoxy-1,4-benzoquinol methylase
LNSRNIKHCPVCLSSDYTNKHQLYDDRYGYEGLFNLLECSSCGHQYLEGAPQEQSLGDLYTEYYPRKSFNPDNFKPYREGGKLYNWLVGGRSSACQSVQPKIRVLDIGCGYGETLAYLKKNKQCDVYGVDADRNVEIISKIHGFKIHVGIFDAAVYEPAFFDAVTMNQVIEHVPDIQQNFSMIAHVLKPGGVCILSTPNANGWGSKLFGRRWLNWHVPYHQHFLSKSSVNRLCDEHGFSLESIQTITRSEWLMYQILHLINYPDQGQPSAFWAPYKVARTGVTRMLQKMVVGTWFLLLPQILTRFFDSIGFGDNYLIIIKKI